MTSCIRTMGMEELPDLFALRLCQVGFPAQRLSGRGITALKEIAQSKGLLAVYPLPFWRHFRIAHKLGKPTIAAWIGSDVYQLLTNKSELERFSKASACIDVHIADAPNLVSELAGLGVHAELVPTISEKMNYKPLPLPVKPVVLSYLTPERHEFYGSEIIMETARLLPDTEFLIIGGYDFSPDCPRNIRPLGYRSDVDDIYRRTSILFRPTIHDGLSQMVLEALGRARHVVWSMPFPHCHHATNAQQAVDAIRPLLLSNQPNKTGADYIAENFTPEAMSKGLAKAMQGLWQS